MSHKVC